VSNKTVTRVELSDAIVREVGLTRQESGDILDRVLDLIGKSLEHENEVKLSRFGNFVVRKKAARAGRNPKPSPLLKSAVESDKD
jgi:integration host factor subunit alpha